LYRTKENTNMNLNLKSLRAIALVAVIGTTSVFAQQAVAPPPHSGMMQDKMAGKGDQSKKMMAMREKMMADMKAMDAKMDLKVTAMNTAEGTAKTMCKQMMEHMAHPDAPMKGMDMGKPPAVSPK
jgi:hypothetical protein